MNYIVKKKEKAEAVRPAVRIFAGCTQIAECNVLAIQRSVFSIQFKQEGFFTHEVMGGPAASGDGGWPYLAVGVPTTS
jgi:hypothetical protein